MTLVERLEAAPVGSREFDEEIAAIHTPTDDRRLAAFESPFGQYPAPYTTSLDAGKTLVAKGRSWAVSYKADEGDVTFATGAVVSGCNPDPHCGDGATPELSLCAAALRARETVG